jgi:hypothetical protein
MATIPLLCQPTHNKTIEWRFQATQLMKIWMPEILIIAAFFILDHLHVESFQLFLTFICTWDDVNPAIKLKAIPSAKLGIFLRQPGNVQKG